jgi:hypothetical protein
MKRMATLVVAGALVLAIGATQLALAGGGSVNPPPPAGQQQQQQGKIPPGPKPTQQQQQGVFIPPAGQSQVPAGIVLPPGVQLVLQESQIDGGISLPKGQPFAVVLQEQASLGFRWAYGTRPRDCIIQNTSVLDTRFATPLRVMTFTPVRTGLLKLTLCYRQDGSHPVVGPVHTLVVTSY